MPHHGPLCELKTLYHKTGAIGWIRTSIVSYKSGSFTDCCDQPYSPRLRGGEQANRTPILAEPRFSRPVVSPSTVLSKMAEPTGVKPASAFTLSRFERGGPITCPTTPNGGWDRTRTCTCFHMSRLSKPGRYRSAHPSNYFTV